MTPFPMPQMTHTAIYVSDLDRLRTFYTEVLGLVVSDEGRGMIFQEEFIFFTGDPEMHHQFVLVTGRAEGAPSTVNQISFHVDSIAHLREIVRRAEAAGAKSIRPLNHGNALSAYILDPEDNMIEIYLDTPWYVHQPYSKPLDLSLPDEEIMRRTEEMVRAEPSFMTRADWMQTVSASIRAKLHAQH